MTHQMSCSETEYGASVGAAGRRVLAPHAGARHLATTGGRCARLRRPSGGTGSSDRGVRLAYGNDLLDVGASPAKLSHPAMDRAPLSDYSALFGQSPSALGPSFNLRPVPCRQPADSPSWFRERRLQGPVAPCGNGSWLHAQALGDISLSDWFTVLNPHGSHCSRPLDTLAAAVVESAT